MNHARRLVGWAILLVGLPILGGCGEKSRATAHGKVTFEGQPIESGYVSFYGKTGTGGGEIIDGEYMARNIPPGESKVKVMVATDTAEATVASTRAEAQKARQTKLKEKPKATKGQGKVAKEASANAAELSVKIQEGDQELDLPFKAKGK